MLKFEVCPGCLIALTRRCYLAAKSKVCPICTEYKIADFKRMTMDELHEAKEKRGT